MPRCLTGYRRLDRLDNVLLPTGFTRARAAVLGVAGVRFGSAGAERQQFPDGCTAEAFDCLRGALQLGLHFMIVHSMRAALRRAVVDRTCLTAGVLAWFVTGCVLDGSCFGQAGAAANWKELKTYKAAGGREVKIPAQPKLKRFRVQEILRSGKVPAEDEPAFEEYFMYVVAEFTFKRNLARLADLRSELKRYYLQEAGRDAGGSELHDRLTQLMLTQFLAIALDEGFAPAVRYNAILVVGDLNLREGTPPRREDLVPLPQAVPPLLDIAGNGQHPYYLRVGALVGIERHLQSRDGIAAEFRRRLAQDLTAILQDATGESAGGVWLRRRATRCLSLVALRYADLIDPGVGTVLGDIVANEKADLAFRCDAAYALGALEERAIPADSVHKILLGMGHLALSVISDTARQTHAEVPSAAHSSTGGPEQASPPGPSGDGEGSTADGGDEGTEGEAADTGDAGGQENDADAEGTQTKDDSSAESDDPFAPDAEQAPKEPSKKKPSSRRSAASTEDPTSTEVRKVVVSTLKYRLAQVRLGLEGVPAVDGTAAARGLAAAGSAEVKPAVVELVGKIKEIEEVASSSLRGSQEEFIQQLLSKRRELEKWQKANTAPQAAAAAGAQAVPQKNPVAAK